MSNPSSLNSTWKRRDEVTNSSVYFLILKELSELFQKCVVNFSSIFKCLSKYYAPTVQLMDAYCDPTEYSCGACSKPDLPG